jgi:hypothetical protein
MRSIFPYLHNDDKHILIVLVLVFSRNETSIDLQTNVLTFA